MFNVYFLHICTKEKQHKGSNLLGNKEIILELSFVLHSDYGFLKKPILRSVRNINRNDK